jgi:hypothetical protein
MPTSINLTALPAIERQRVELDKRAAFLMWSLVLQQPRKRGGLPMTRIEISRELLDQRDISGELHAWFRDRLNHYLAHYKRQRDGDREELPQAPLTEVLDIYKGNKPFEKMGRRWAKISALQHNRRFNYASAMEGVAHDAL